MAEYDIEITDDKGRSIKLGDITCVQSIHGNTTQNITVKIGKANRSFAFLAANSFNRRSAVSKVVAFDGQNLMLSTYAQNLILSGKF